MTDIVVDVGINDNDTTEISLNELINQIKSREVGSLQIWDESSGIYPHTSNSLRTILSLLSYIFTNMIHIIIHIISIIHYLFLQYSLHHIEF